MNIIRIPYGKSFLELKLPFVHFDLIYPKIDKSINNQDEIKAVMVGLGNPVLSKSKTAKKLLLGKKKIAITINDHTRPIPYHKILPLLIHYLEEKGADRSNIEYFIASGTHRSMSSDEIAALLPGPYVKNNKIICHNCDDYQNLLQIGETRLKTPVIINTAFLQADIKIVTGNIEPHHFMGYSGGVKSASIGLAGRETIEINHRMLLDPNAKIGTFSNNPMRMDVEEIGSMIPVDFALNVVQNHNHEIEVCVFGDPYLVIERGIEISKKKTQIDITKRYDLVIASPGGHPKDINFYQAQKAISNACLFAKDNGVIILIAACEEGSGNLDFENFIKSANSLEELIQNFSSTAFRVGPHKAFQLGLQSMNHHIILVSALPDSFVEKLFIKPAACFDDALFQAQKFIGLSPQVAVLPFATHCIPSQEIDGFE